VTYKSSRKHDTIIWLYWNQRVIGVSQAVLTPITHKNPNHLMIYGSSGFAVVLGVGAAASTPKTTEIPNEPDLPDMRWIK
jgi:hypothetical protein